MNRKLFAVNPLKHMYNGDVVWVVIDSLHAWMRIITFIIGI